MKKYKHLILKIALILISFFVISLLPLRTSGTIFVMKDKANDDYGGGRIEYPTYISEKNLFDMRMFTVKDEGDYYSFDVKMENVLHDDNEKNGFAELLLDIYISLDDIGLNVPLSYGAAVNMDEASPWKYHLRITPRSGYLEYIKDVATIDSERIDCEVSLNGKTISILVPKEYIEGDLADGKYYVFSAGHDIFGPDEYRRVLKDESEYEFSGGIVSLQQPNVIDTLNRTQEKQLSYFMPPYYATVFPVYQLSYQKYILKEYLYIIVALGSLLILFFELKKWKKSE